MHRTGAGTSCITYELGLLSYRFCRRLKKAKLFLLDHICGLDCIKQCTLCSISRCLMPVMEVL